jgi:hypothetical protein
MPFGIQLRRTKCTEVPRVVGASINGPGLIRPDLAEGMIAMSAPLHVRSRGTSSRARLVKSQHQAAVSALRLWGVEPIDLDGQTMLQLLNKAADAAEENRRHAIDVAEKLSHQINNRAQSPASVCERQTSCRVACDANRG